ncbi:PREDICTED: nuclear pore complex protein NUP50A [Tarenaya hassleriana]|uniref:nuclear pore complex protein NUP50A n=1 Tax=Tarenaya hassleriana TaxID=28532 RepID=UPI00053C33A5|nr:PREDICTED: nuclear pore complex protein NUP50A [Tarenaya hassleriana]
MGESESAQQSKKRAAVKELSRDNPGLDDEEDSAELESGTFKRASDEVLASRRIVRIKRKEAPATMSSSNPFAGICLVPPTGPSAETNSSLAESKSAEATVETVAEAEKPAPDDQRTDGIKENNAEEISTGDDAESKCSEVNDQETGKPMDQVTDAAADNCNTAKETDQTGDGSEKESVDDQTKNEEKKENRSENLDKNGDGGSLSSFQQHSSTKNAFTGLAGTGFSSSSFSSGPFSQEGCTGSVSLFGQKTDQPSFSFGNGNSSSLFGASATSVITTKSESSAAFPPKQEVSVETGEENERAAFSADSVLFEYIDGAWKERGKGEVKVNVSIRGGNGGKARLVMRAKGNYRLILNAGLFPDMKLTNMDKKGITFACLNSIGDGKDGLLSTFALKFKDPTTVEEFRTVVMLHKEGKPVEAAPLKTPENSP